VLADAALLGLALTLVDDIFLDVLDHWEIRADRNEIERQISVARRACGARIVIATRPPIADQVIHGEVVLTGFLDRGRVHGAEALEIEPTRTVAADVEPLRRLVLHFRGRHRNWLLAIGRVEIDKAKLLALELVESAFLAGDVANEH